MNPDLLEQPFPNAGPQTRDELTASVVLHRYAAGETVSHQGDRDRLLLVTDGHVGLRRITLDGRCVMGRIAASGDLATILPLGDRETMAEAIALTDATVASWPAELVRTMARSDEGLATDLFDRVLDTLETAIQSLDVLVHQGATVRVARVLLVHGALLFGPDAPLPRRHLPAMVGTSREMTGRVLRTLEREGIVARVGRGLRLLDAKALEEAALMPAA